ncbi:MAG: SDR family oxidoreductase [Pseudarcicella sp.]|nr:SDR family oxidoreductase [Pseudarcicella sp.]
MDFTNKIALITGGTKGIGLGVAEVLIAAGIKVCITGREQHTVDQAVSHLNAIKPEYAIGYMADARNMVSQQNSVNYVLNHWGQLDFVIANAGVAHLVPVQDLTIEQWHETIDINLTGPFYTLKASLDALKASKGYFITISSLAGTNFFANASAYNASKFGLTGFSQAIMLDLRKEGIKVSTIMPGTVATSLNNHVLDSEKDAWMIQPEDIGQIVLDLLKMNPRTLPSKIEVRPAMPK